jgi:hypothetical protein
MNKSQSTKTALSFSSPIGASNWVESNIKARASESLKSLIETKHLYQKVIVPYDEIVSEARNALVPGHQQEFYRLLKSIQQRFSIADQNLRAVGRGNSSHSVFQLIIGNVKLFCQKCKRREAFQPVWWTDAANELRTQSLVSQRGLEIPEDIQWFHLMYQCQSCKGLPEIMLVRREKWTFFLEGRSPMENVVTENYIPKAESHWFRDALIAFNAGKTLAALFYLRTFIEQFARRQTQLDGRTTGTTIMSKYIQLLPDKHRDSMPSLGEWYDKLSEALHGAKEDAVLFEDARKQIEHHFDVRRVFQIAETSPSAKD